MKLLRNSVLAIILFAGLQFAQAQKIAHIDSETLLMAMPEAKAMENELKKLSRDLCHRIQNTGDSFAGKIKKIQ
ncbi:MAG: hypothetical protein U5K51_17590 [Flavobacteriaceae bacterium]|nr:hypothetical protein [Flavobacteriaceae bacterium]